MQEVAPGLFHWTAHHEGIGIEVSSYYWAEGEVLLDPMLPPGGLAWFEGREPKTILLTNRHHDRQAGALVDAFGCEVRCPEAGLHEYARKALKPRGYRPGERLAGGIVALEVGALCPDEMALLLPIPSGALAVADGVVRRGDSPLEFVQDAFMGDDPEAVKAGLRAAYAQIAREHAFEHLLLAHGEPWIGGARAALARFARGASAARRAS